MKNNSFAGIYIADRRGYFAEEGFSGVNLIAGGPNIVPDASIVSGKAVLGTANTDTTATARWRSCRSSSTPSPSCRRTSKGSSGS